jgi:hypothetical protein
MTLSYAQIDTLFAFVEKKRVQWYDLQIELVDHLANKIEEEFEQNPKTNFDAALAKVYLSFGIFGFARIVREKEDQLRKSNNKLWISEFKNQFVWPNLLRSIVLFFIIKLLFTAISLEYIFIIGLALILINFIFQLISKKKQASSNKKLLLTQYYLWPNYLGFLYYQVFSVFWNYDSIGNVSTITGYILIAVIFLVILSYLSSMQVASKINKKARALYPEAFIIAN